MQDASLPANKLLSLAEFARVAASIDAGISREEVLEEARISVSDWEHTQETWLSRIARQAAERRYTLHALYVKLFEAARRAALARKRSKRRELKGVVPVPPDSRMSPILAAPTPLRRRVTGAPSPQRSLGAAAVAAAPATPRLTLEQLATLRAELVLAPDGASEIRERFGLNERTHEQEDAIWQERFQKDKDLFQRYVKLFQYFRSLLAPR